MDIKVFQIPEHFQRPKFHRSIKNPYRHNFSKMYISLRICLEIKLTFVFQQTVYGTKIIQNYSEGWTKPFLNVRVKSYSATIVNNYREARKVLQLSWLINSASAVQ